MARRRRKRPFQDIRAFLQRRAASIAGFFAHIAEGVRGHLPRKRKSRGQRAASQPAPAAPVKEKGPFVAHDLPGLRRGAGRRLFPALPLTRPTPAPR